MSNSNSDNPQAGQNRPLPKKDQDTFRQIVRQYETKQYKKGIKSADSILKRFPRHGETLCMKGLILNCMGKGKEKRDEAINMVKMGLMNDMRSHVCWHVYGLIYRSERNYSEAIKAYKQALKIDPQNIQILRDLSLLQIQMRDLNGFVKTRHSILDLKPNQKTNWLTFALSKHLLGHIDEAINIIDIYLDTLKQDSEANGSSVGQNPEFQCNYESSELALYKNQLICEKQETLQKQKSDGEPAEQQCIDYKEPYEHLLSISHLVKDKYSFLQTKARYELYLGQFYDAKETYLQLFDTFGATEDYSVHSGYMCSILKLDSKMLSSFHSLLKQPTIKKLLSGARTLATILPLSREQKDILYEDYSTGLLKKYPKSHTVRRIPLTLLDHESEEWKDQIGSYIQRQLKRGVPSLGSDLASLFLIEANKFKHSDGAGGEEIQSYYIIATEPCDIEKHVIYVSLSNLVNEYITSLEQHSKFPTGGENGDDVTEPPSTLLWTWYLRAVFYDLAGQYSKGIEVTAKCLEQTPTAVDIYELQGKIYEHAGDIQKAVSSTNEGRLLDKQDRYINNQTVKYLLQAGNEKEALDTIALFTRHESNSEQNIYDMQCYWYEMELGNCLLRKGLLGKALKKFIAIEKHFEDFNEDQFDFHAYCIRKVTIRSYVQVLRWEDALWGHDVYADAAEAIINTHLGIFDNPPKTVGDEASEPDYSKMTPAERKKAKAQVRKKKKKAEKKAEEEAKKAEEEAKNKKSGKGGEPPKPKDEDPDGKELLKLDPLEQAKKYTSTLVKNAPTRLSTWLCQYDVAVRRKKFLIALKALKKAKKIESYYDNGEVFSRMVDFAKLDIKPHDNVDVQQIFESEKLALFDGKSLDTFISSVAEGAKDCRRKLNLKVAVAKAMTDADKGTTKEACEIVTGSGLDTHGMTVDSCVESIKYLRSLGDSDEYVSKTRNEWIDLTKTRFFLKSI